MTDIRKLMGVCPQFDILWDELTAAEHLRIYSKIKGVPD
jgi:ABC-type multidrug transport system ATPase subunit